MATLSKLIETNHLTNQGGLWVLDQPTQFNYSDGEGSELFLKRVVSEARDLSSQSLDLETCYPDWDWVAEYHLSYKRANLLRGLNLSQIENALEIGCGCGAITRYLGEQGICVDAIEGAQRRADIAQLRCRDLDNVRIINANYNDLQIPEKSYDAIIAVGVIEYTGKFLYASQSEEAAVITILKQLQRTLTEEGVLIIAIENRNGLKYWLGATEDHFGQPYVGLSAYWGHSGTKTYTYNEWQSLLKQVGIEHWHFQFPFPDYKLPQVILDQTFIDNDENAYSLLYRIHSRDYLRPWQPGANEFSLWRALHQSNQLKEFANSFLIFAGCEASSLETLLPADFVYFSGGSRKPAFRTMTLKARRSDQVTKKYLWTREADAKEALIQQSPNSPYFNGPLLSTVWLEALLASDIVQFQMLLDRYYQYINRQFSGDTVNAVIDALPANIVVDFNGHYHIIDQEWHNDQSVTADYILFRALLWFGHDNQRLLKGFFQTKGFLCLGDFIEFCFHWLSRDPAPLLSEYILREEAFQFDISGQKNLRPIQQLLDARFSYAAPYSDSLKLYWAGENQSFTETRSCEVNYRFENGRARIRCRFVFDRKVARVRIMPLCNASEAKLLLLERITLSQQTERSKDAAAIWEAKADEKIAASAEYNHFVMPLLKLKGAFIASDRRAALDFPVTFSSKPDAAEYGLFGFELRLAGEARLGPSFVTEYLRRKTGAVEQQNDRYRQIIADRNANIRGKNAAIVAKDDETRRLKVQLEDTRQRKRKTEAGLSAVKSELEKTRQLLARLAKVKFIRSIGQIMPGKYGWISSDLNQYGQLNFNSDEYELVKCSGLFDEAFYQKYKPDLSSSNGDMLRHYLTIGWLKGLRPNRLFETVYYLEQYPELVTNKLNPLVHYLKTGIKEGNSPCYLFDIQYYRSQCHGIAENAFSALQNYLEEGGKKGIDPHPAFDTHYYFLQCPEAKESDLTPLEHFIEFGEVHQISPTPLFDWAYYMGNRPDLRELGVSGFRHFIEQGYKEVNSDPLKLFKRDFYFRGDLHDLKYKANPICHYILEGQNDFRSPNPFFDIAYYVRQLTPSEICDFKDPFSHYIVEGAQRRLNPHPLIDVDYYCSQLAKIDIHPDNLFEYFNEEGFDRIVLSHPFLDTGYCIAQLYSVNGSEDIHMRDYYHEDRYGPVHNTHPLFDAEYYRSQFESNQSHFKNPLIHYLKEGRERGISTHPDFDLEYYCSCDHYPELNDDYIPSVHYIYHGSQNEKWPSLAIEQLAFKPQLHLILLVNGPDFSYLSSRVVALMAQLYPRWKATIMVRNPDASDDYRYAMALAEDDKRIQWIETDDTDSASTLFNRALEKISDEFVVFLDEQMYLKACALLVFVRQLNRNPDLMLLHTDRNKNDPDAIPIEALGSEFNSLSTRYYIGPLGCFKRSLIDQMGGLSAWHQSVNNERFLAHYLHQAPSNSIAHVSGPLHYTMAKDPLSIVVRNK